MNIGGGGDLKAEQSGKGERTGLMIHSCAKPF